MESYKIGELTSSEMLRNRTVERFELTRISYQGIRQNSFEAFFCVIKLFFSVMARLLRGRLPLENMPDIILEYICYTERKLWLWIRRRFTTYNKNCFLLVSYTIIISSKRWLLQFFKSRLCHIIPESFSTKRCCKIRLLKGLRRVFVVIKEYVCIVWRHLRLQQKRF